MKHIINRLTLLTALLISGIGFSQKNYVNLEWVANTPVVDSIYHSSSIAQQGYVYTTGNIINGSGDADVYTYVLDYNGDTVWTATESGSLSGGNDYGVDLALNNSGDVIITAAIENSGSDYDFAVYQYDGTTGSQDWSYEHDGTGGGIDIPAKILYNTSFYGPGIYVCGGSQASGGGMSDFGILKLSTSGSFLWDQYYDYNDLHDAAINVGVIGPVVITSGGSAADVADWDIANLVLNISTGAISSTTRTDTNVTMVEANAMTTDTLNNLYVTGFGDTTGNDKYIETIKLDSNLDEVWVRTHNVDQYDDVGKDIGVDTAGNVYVTGYTELENGGYNFLTVKYSKDGDTLWVRNIGNAGTEVETAKAEKIVVTPEGQVYFTGTIERDTTSVISFMKLDSSGSTLIAKETESDTVDHRAYDIDLDGEDIYITGLANTVGQTTYTVLKYSTNVRDMTPVTQNDTALYVADELIISFHPDSMNTSMVNNKNKTFAPLSDFVTDGVMDQLDAEYPGCDWDRAIAYKIHQRMTTNDTISITRTGHEIPIPKFWSSLVVRVDGEDEEDIRDSLNLNGFPSVLGADVNQIYMPSVDDPYFNSNQLSLYESVSYPDADINAENAWTVETGKNKIKVGVYDTGIRFDHEDFGSSIDPEGKMRGGWDYAAEVDLSVVDNNGDPDTYGHGTRVAGIIGALSNNTTGIAGIAGGNWPYEPGEFIPEDPNPGENQGVALYGFRLGSHPGYTHDAVMEALVEGPTYSTEGFGHGMHIMNCSFSGNLTDIEKLNEMYDAQLNAFRNGTVLVASKGNESSESKAVPAYSKKDFWVLSVGGSNTDGEWHSSANYGHGIDVVAPYPEDLVYTTDNASNSAYSTFSGTSAAAPHVTGLAGLMLSHINDDEATVNNLTPDDVEFLIQRYRKDIVAGDAEVGYDDLTGWGLIDAGNVMDSIDKSKFVIRHYYKNIEFDLSSSNVDSSFCGGTGPCTDFYFPGNEEHDAGNYSVRVYNISTTASHSLNPGDVIIDSWSLNSYTNLIMNEAGTPISESEAEMSTTMVTTSSAFLQGHVFKVMTHAGGPDLDEPFWWPIKPGDTAKFGYTLHIESTYAGEEENDTELTNALSCYPNPANDKLVINFTLQERSNVAIRIVDINGRQINAFESKPYKAGQHNVNLNVNNMAKGVYIIEAKIGDETFNEKFIKQ